MRIIVELDYSSNGINSSEELRRYYEKYFNEDTFFSEEYEAIYYYIDLPFIPIEGQRIGTKFGRCIVTYSYIELHPIEGDFFEQSKIVVREE